MLRHQKLSFQWGHHSWVAWKNHSMNRNSYESVTSRFDLRLPLKLKETFSGENRPVRDQKYSGWALGKFPHRKIGAEAPVVALLVCQVKKSHELLSKPLLYLNAIQHLRFPIAFSTFGVLKIWGYRLIVLYTWALTVFFMWLLLHPQRMRSCYCHCC